MGKSRIAVVSTDGVTVDDHFGRADHFLIYDLDNQMALVEKRSTETLSVGNPDHLFDADKFARISALLKDCSKVYVTKIGDIPAAKCKQMGVEPVIYAGAIADIANR